LKINAIKSIALGRVSEANIQFSTVTQLVLGEFLWNEKSFIYNCAEETGALNDRYATTKGKWELLKST
jgi:hypothetical protein